MLTSTSKSSVLRLEKFENTFVNIVNGQEMVAKVTTHTPEPPKPEEPGKPKQSLPNTGTQVACFQL